MEFRKADIIDRDALVEMRMLYLADDIGSIAPNIEKQIKEQLPDYFERHLNRDLFVYIAEDGAKAVSCCMLIVTEKPANTRFPHGLTGSVLNVYTRQEYRRQGLAGKLMHMLINDAVELGLDLIELKATSDGIKLYKSLGFDQDFSKYTEMKLVL